VSCDSVACIGESSAGFTYAIIRDPAGFAEECDRDLIVTRIRAPSWCGASTVIDAENLYDNGVQWLKWNAGERRFAVRSAITNLERNWRIKP
jgi:competence protein ComEC